MPYSFIGDIVATLLSNQYIPNLKRLRFYKDAKYAAPLSLILQLTKL
jgi:hypothetical protein